MNSQSEVKARAHRLRDVLSAMGLELNHSQSLEVISKTEGYSDWNTYTAYIKKQQQISERYPGDDIAAISSDHPVIYAIKSDDETLLRTSLTKEVLRNKSIMAEAFCLSVTFDRVSLAEVMIDQGADVGSVLIRQKSLFEFAIQSERESYCKRLILKLKDRKDIHPKSSIILPMAIDLLDKKYITQEFIDILLNQGANINAQAHDGETALLMAGLSSNNRDLITFLVERGADVNLSNEHGCTPLMDAAELGKNEILEYLLAKGADIHAKKNNGASALDMARSTENTDAIEILTSKSGLNT